VLLHYLVKRRNTKIAFSLKRFISALSEFNQLLDFFNLFDSRLILRMLYDSLNHVINAFSPQGCWGMVQEKGSRQRCRSWTVLHAQSTSALSSGFPISQGGTFFETRCTIDSARHMPRRESYNLDTLSTTWFDKVLQMSRRLSLWYHDS